MQTRSMSPANERQASKLAIYKVDRLHLHSGTSVISLCIICTPHAFFCYLLLTIPLSQGYNGDMPVCLC